MPRGAHIARAALVAASLGAASVAPGATPELPRTTVDTTLVPPAGATVVVRAGADLQAALDAAQPGDAIALEPGATFAGSFVLPAKPGREWITIRPAVSDDRLPAPGTRIDPSAAAGLPKLEAASGSVVTAAPGAHHYRFIGIELRPRAGVFLYNLVTLGWSEAAVGDLPHHIVFDRCYLHGDASKGGRRGIAMNGWALAVIDSHLSDFKEAGNDSQAIAGWNGMGPFKIANNYLEGAGENVMFGGAVPAIADMVPADVEIRGNHFSKPAAWQAGSAGVEGTAWTVKNLLELKNARRVLVEGNVFERNWVQAQNGFAILFTVRTEDGAAAWAVVEDVTFRNNTVRHVGSGVNILGRDPPRGQTRRVSIRNNLFDDVGGEKWGGGGTLLQTLEGAVDVAFEHNTAFQTGRVLLADGEPTTGFVFRDNIAPQNEYGIIGSGAAPGRATLAAYFPGALVGGNAFVGGRPELYPPGNFFPASMADVGFVDRTIGDYRLAASSPYRAAGTDGRDVGIVFSEFGSAVAGARSRAADPPPAPVGKGGPESGRSSARARAKRAGVAVFWGSGLGLAYTYLGYPLLIGAWASRRRPRTRQAEQVPRVSIVVSARDEAAGIGARIANLRALDYPTDRLEVLLASDGSTDGTAERARSHTGAGLRVFEFPSRRGKPAVLNELVPQAAGDIVVLADARQRFEPDALRALVAPFADPAVGAVSGELILTPGTGTGVGESVGAYWRYEKSVRRHESRVDSTVGATGAIYAIRRSLFEPLPEDTLLDDVLVPLRITRRGYRVLFEPSARAYDRVASSGAEEFRRKVRTLAGNFQLFARNPWLLDPRRNRLWLQTVSHKALRLLTPALLVAALAANILLARSAFYACMLGAQAVFYAGAVAGYALQGFRRPIPYVTIPYVICLLSWATVVGFVRFVTGRQRVTWERASA